MARSEFSERAIFFVNRSNSERNCVLGFFLILHHAQLAALLDAVVEVAPELQEILASRDQRADHHEPQ